MTRDEGQHLRDSQRRRESGLLQRHAKPYAVPRGSRVTTEDLHPTGTGLALPAEQSDQSGLSGPIRAQQPEQLAAGKVERDVVQSDNLSVGSACSVDASQGRLSGTGVVLMRCPLQ